jgi:hypothetical protein
MSPDLYQGSYDPTNPQSFNRYAYALNNPANLLDPSGLDPGGPDCGADNTVCVDGGGYGGVVVTPSSCLTLYACEGLVPPVMPVKPKTPNVPGVAPNGPQPPAKQQSKLMKYVTFLGCEFNSDLEQLTDEEDAQSIKQIPIVVTTAAVVGTVRGFLPGWTGLTGAITGGLYVINIAGSSNIGCTDSVYGN